MALGVSQIPSGDDCAGCCEKKPCTMRQPRWVLYAQIPDDGNQKPTLDNSYLVVRMSMASCPYGTTGTYDCFGLDDTSPPYPNNGWPGGPLFSPKLLTYDGSNAWSRSGRPDGLNIKLTFEEDGTETYFFETYQRLKISKIEIERDGNKIVWNIDPDNTNLLVSDFEAEDTSIDCVFYTVSGAASMPVVGQPNSPFVFYAVRIWEESELPETLTATINDTGECTQVAAHDICSTADDMCDRLIQSFDLELQGTPTTIDGRVVDSTWSVNVSGSDTDYDPAYLRTGGWPWLITISAQIGGTHPGGGLAWPFDATFQASGGAGPAVVTPEQLSFERWDDTQEDASATLNVTWRWKANSPFPGPRNDCGGPVASGTMVITE